jgi:hypothetical protein
VNPMVLRGRWLLFWRMHFAFALAVAIVLAWWVIAGMETTRLVAVSAMAPRTLAALVMPCLLTLGLLVAEGGFIAQSAIEKRSFWRAVFLGVSVLVAIGVLVELPLFEQFVDRLLEGERAIGVLAAVVLAGQLWSSWLYAYRSDHLWEEALE